NEEPTKSRHGKWLDRPVDKERHPDTAPMLLNLAERGKVDLDEHWYDHQPDQYRHWQVDLRDLGSSDRLEHSREKMTQHDAGHHAQRHPCREVSLKRCHVPRFPNALGLAALARP